MLLRSEDVTYNRPRFYELELHIFNFDFIIKQARNFNIDTPVATSYQTLLIKVMETVINLSLQMEILIVSY